MAAGRMVRCSNEPCQRATRVIGPRPEDGSDEYTCSGCESGQAPFIAGGSRDFGQPKQRKGAK